MPKTPKDSLSQIRLAQLARLSAAPIAPIALIALIAILAAGAPGVAWAQGQPAQPAQPAQPSPPDAQPDAPDAKPDAQPKADAPDAKPDAQPKADADAQPVAPSRSTVLHVPPSAAPGGQPLRIVAVVDAAWTEAALEIRYRHRGATEFAAAPFERSSAGGYFATIPADVVVRPGVEYYIAGQLPRGDNTLHFASADAPHVVVVAPTQSERWAEKERERLGGRLSTMSADVTGQDFGNRFGNDDRYLRGELDFTHRLLTRLYSISLGYGFIEGSTPSGEGNMAVSELQGARYGYAGVMLRLHDSVWLKGRTAIGVSRDEFIVGGTAVVTLGKPWRSSVDLGAEYFDELGPSLWVRLQWDTVPPLMMGATILKTDLPAASLTGGALIAYDVGYPITPRITLRGSVSFGSRDGPGRVGGGLGTQFAF